VAKANPPPELGPQNAHHARLLGLVLMAAGWSVYGRTVLHDFLLFDDVGYVLLNPHVQSGITLRGITWALTSFHASNWHPLTWLSHMTDCAAYGLDPAGHHFNNVLLHVGSALLLFLLLREATASLSRSFLVAMLFVVHPLHVESVAWIAERKDVLSTFLALLSALFYIRYATSCRAAPYFGALVLFFLSLLAKPMPVTLPFLFLLLDYWPLGRTHRATGAGSKGPYGRGAWGAAREKPLSFLLWEKLPFLLLSVGSCVMTYWAQTQGGAVRDMETLPLGARLSNAFVAYARYVGKTALPTDLAVFYPHPGDTLGAWQVAGSVFALAAFSWAAIKVRDRHPYLPMGWFWFLGALTPVIGLVQVGDQAMADRYTYLPTVGLLIGAVWWSSDRFLRRGLLRHARACMFGALILAYSHMAWTYAGSWKDTRHLFEHALRVTGGNYAAHLMLARDLASRGALDAAMDHYGRAVALSPGFVAKMHNRAGSQLVEAGNLDAAIAQFEAALALRPHYPSALNNLGVALAGKGFHAQARLRFLEAVQIRPAFERARENLQRIEPEHLEGSGPPSVDSRKRVKDPL